jgi:Predicted redox protein, regulator of disulfide bond formation
MSSPDRRGSLYLRQSNNPALELDVSGLVCPQSAAVVRRCLAELEAGEELVVTGDYPPAERSIRRSCHRHGFEVSEGPAEDGEFSLRILATESAALGAEPATQREPVIFRPHEYPCRCTH